MKFMLSNLVESTNGTVINASSCEIQSINTDSRKQTKNSLFLALEGDKFDGHKYIEDAIQNGAVAICINKTKQNLVEKLTIPVLLVDDTLLAYQNIAKHYRQSLKNLTIIGITGSAGKTSTKEILKSILEESFGENAVYATIANTNNHIGVPQNILNIGKNIKYAIIEMGTNHPNEIKVLADIATPDIAIITSIGHSHIENFGSVANIAKEKFDIFSNMNPANTAIIPDDYIGLANFKLNIKTVGSECGSYCVNYKGSNLKSSSFEVISKKGFHKIDWSIPGKHQAINATFAIAVAEALNISESKIKTGLQKAKLTGMRMKIIKSKDYTWINDAYNANPESVSTALNWLSEFIDETKTTLILGDMLELGSNSEKYHKKILKKAFELFPKIEVFCVGEIYGKVFAEFAKQNIQHYSNAESAKECLKKIPQNNLIFLKGSRGIKLEQLLDN